MFGNISVVLSLKMV